MEPAAEKRESGMTEWLAQPVDGEFVVMVIAVIGAFILGGVLGR